MKFKGLETLDTNEKEAKKIIDSCPLCQTPVTIEQFFGTTAEMFLAITNEIVYPCSTCGIKLIGQQICKNCGEALDIPLPWVPCPFCGIKAKSWIMKLQILV